MAAKWVPCGDGFIETDVIRWTDGVWQHPLRGKAGRAVNIGAREITAEVLADQDGWLHLVVRACTVTSEKPGHSIPVLEAGQELRRKRQTIEKARPERRLWSDETARAALIRNQPRRPE